MKLKIKKINKDAIIPEYANFDDAGLDLSTISDVSIEKGESAIIETGIAMEIPVGYVALIWDRSGLGIKYSLKTMGGVIDSGYRGEIKVGMINHGKETYHFKKGEKVAQILIQKKENPEIIEVDELSDSERGEKGMGSSGK